MIDDLSVARPQSGLSQADVVWHAPAEGGIPRYMALFQSTLPTSVGPIRSSRLYYIAWASEWKSVYVHAGGSPQALALLRSSQGRGKVVYNADEYRWNRYLYRVHYRRPPHNVYSDAKNLQKLSHPGRRKAGPGAGSRVGVRSRRPTRREAGGRQDRRPLPREQDHLQL